MHAARSQVQQKKKSNNINNNSSRNSNSNSCKRAEQSRARVPRSQTHLCCGVLGAVNTQVMAS